MAPPSPHERTLAANDSEENPLEAAEGPKRSYLGKKNRNDQELGEKAGCASCAVGVGRESALASLLVAGLLIVARARRRRR